MELSSREAFAGMDPSMTSVSTQDEADANISSISETSSESRIPPLCRPETLRSWLSTCETAHEWCPWKHPTRPIQFRLIDVDALCIKDFLNTSDRPLRYAALSYVWGSKPQRLKLTQANQDALHREGGMETSRLSRTISDAISVVRMLGERYLWVDSLCIIQDSSEDLAFQIPLVGYIYVKALVTIVAGSGDHNDAGLPGIGGWERLALPGCKQELPKINGDKSATKLSRPIQFGILPHLEDSIWETRGWTYQEKLLSRRCLIFTEKLVCWECQCASWSEDAPMQTDTLEQMRDHDTHQSFFLSEDHFSRAGHVGEPGGHHGLCLTHFVPSFTARHLTYDRDAGRAFAGILQVLMDLGHYRTFHGLPLKERQFVRCLSWLPSQAGCSLRHQQDVPTWSWLAWKGSIFIFSDPLADETIDIQCYCMNIDDHGDRYLQRVEESPSDKDLCLNYQQIPEAARMFLKPNFHLLFWAETAVLLVGEDGSITNTLPNKNASSDLTARNDAESKVSGSYDGLAGAHPFFCLRTMLWEMEEHIEAMIITWDNGFAYRLASAEINWHIWMAASPKRELIILG
jgi:hypothetical protein